MARSLALFAIGLVFGGGAGFVLAAANGVTFDGHDHGDPAYHGGSSAEAMAHDHSTAVNLPAGADAPGVAIQPFGLTNQVRQVAAMSSASVTKFTPERT